MTAFSQNPLADFRYCPRCGADGLSLRGARSVYCAACRFRFFLNCASAAAAFVFHGEHLILAVRGKEPAKGALDLPGGFIEFDESAEDAMRREIREELNIEVRDLSYFTSAPNNYFYDGVWYKVTDLYFTARADDIAAMIAGDDVASFVLLRPEALDPARLAFDSGRLALQRLLAARA